MHREDAAKAAVARLGEALELLDSHQCGQFAALHVSHAIDLLRESAVLAQGPGGVSGTSRSTATEQPVT